MSKGTATGDGMAAGALSEMRDAREDLVTCNALVLDITDADQSYENYVCRPLTNVTSQDTCDRS